MASRKQRKRDKDKARKTSSNEEVESHLLVSGAIEQNRIRAEPCEPDLGALTLSDGESSHTKIPTSFFRATPTTGKQIKKTREKVRKVTRPAKAAGACEDDDEDDADDCVICTEKISYVSFGHCNHKMVCSTCALRNRILFKNLKCAYCNVALDRVVITADKKRTWESFTDSIWGAFCGKELVVDEEAGAFFHDKKHLQETRRLRGFGCGANGCHASLKNFKELESHLWGVHKLKLCKVCVEAEGQRKFVSELPRFTKQAYDRHMKKGNAKSEGFDGHPECHFCKTRFYGDDELFNHLNKEHYRCHVCEQGGKSNQYFRNYAHLESHFRRDHFLCEQKECLGKRFIAFLTELEYKGHMANEHPSVKFSRKIDVNFKIGRSSREESREIAFGDGDPLTFDYTPSGERVDFNANADEYPSLHSAGGDVGVPPRWVGPSGSVTASRGSHSMGGSHYDFPVLGGSSSRNFAVVNAKSADDFPSLPTQTRKQKKERRARDLLGKKTGPPARVIAPPTGSGIRVRQKEEAGLSDGPEWTCPSCTLINAGWKPTCSACGTGKRRKAKKEKNYHDDQKVGAFSSSITNEVDHSVTKNPSPPPRFTSPVVVSLKQQGAGGGSDMVSMVQKALNNDGVAFSNFQTLCRKYVGGTMTAREYFMTVKRMFDFKDLKLFFPLLVATLPEEALQAPLNQLFMASVADERERNGSGKSTKEKVDFVVPTAPTPSQVYAPLTAPSNGFVSSKKTNNRWNDRESNRWNGKKVVALGGNAKKSSGPIKQLKSVDVSIPNAIAAGLHKTGTNSVGAKNKKPKGKKKNQNSKELQEMAFVRY